MAARDEKNKKYEIAKRKYAEKVCRDYLGIDTKGCEAVFDNLYNQCLRCMRAVFLATEEAICECGVAMARIIAEDICSVISDKSKSKVCIDLLDKIMLRGASAKKEFDEALMTYFTEEEREAILKEIRHFLGLNDNQE
jgi:hypothetical protein